MESNHQIAKTPPRTPPRSSAIIDLTFATSLLPVCYLKIRAIFSCHTTLAKSGMGVSANFFRPSATSHTPIWVTSHTLRHFSKNCHNVSRVAYGSIHNNARKPVLCQVCVSIVPGLCQNANKLNIIYYIYSTRAPVCTQEAHFLYDLLFLFFIFFFIKG